MISPYEADAQLCFLQRINYIDYIITEDSDLIIYGAKKILYKYSGTHVDEYDYDRLHQGKDIHFKDNILDICILSGCDYLDSIRGVGLVTAHKKLQETGSVKKFVDHMITLNKPVPDDYLEKFNKAKLAFLHHIVYNPLNKKREFLTEPIIEHDFFGTLEDLPFSYKNITIDRHFKPMEIALNSIEINESKVTEECLIDSNTVSPFF